MGRIWVAHDKDAFTVWLYNEKPTLDKVTGCFYSKAEDVVGNVDESLLPDVTYENSPIEYEIIFKKHINVLIQFLATSHIQYRLKMHTKKG